MEPFDLPPELAEIERRLTDRCHPPPTSVFRERVLSAMRAERSPKRSLWNVAAVLAASVFLCLNFGLSLTNHRAWSEPQWLESADVETSARSIRQRHPDLSAWEAHQFAILLQSPPALPASLGGNRAWEGEESWDMR